MRYTLLLISQGVPEELKDNFLSLLPNIEQSLWKQRFPDKKTYGAEIEEFANRLEIARLLLKGGSYQKIAKQTGVSTTTVTRVAHWLFKGCGGYYKVLRNLK